MSDTLFSALHMHDGEDGEQIFHLHLVSDSTGETLEAIIAAALVQFEGVRVEKHYWPLIRSALQMERLMDDIRELPGLVMYTLVNPDIRATLEEGCKTAQLPVLSILDPVINLLGSYFGQRPTQRPGRQHIMDAHYFDRVDAIHFTMAHDDGQLTEELPHADIILVGVSRTSKTPTSIYLANKGYKTANIPFVPNVPMPEALAYLNNTFIIGLTTSPERLAQIRTNRLRSLNETEDGDYTDIQQIREEVAACRRYCGERGWSTLDVTRRSIEESAAAILNKYHAWLDARSVKPAKDGAPSDPAAPTAPADDAGRPSSDTGTDIHAGTPTVSGSATSGHGDIDMVCGSPDDPDDADDLGVPGGSRPGGGVLT